MPGTREGAAKARARAAAKKAAGGAMAVAEPPEAPSPVSGGLETRSKPRGPYLEVGRRPIKHGRKVYQPGQEFPARIAARIPRIEGWLRTGMLVQR